ncbi:sensor histidine kinase [Nocardioides daejeonensis]|uniref:sensor histidine kinase n=1 Tax=Nocardioides daejeonensis TaxID=1046556 RepID=UPI000D744D28|nr:sensor histidine kinase [Nocardioides daejeonensis]
MQKNVWIAKRWWLLPVMVIIGAGSVGTNLAGEGQYDAGYGARVAAVACALLAAATLVAIDRQPAVLVVTGALCGGYFALGGENGPIFFVLIVAAFLLALRRPVRVWLPALLAAAVLLWLGLLVRGLRWDELVIGTWQSIGVGALVAAATAIGTSVRHGRAAGRDRVSRVAAEERLRMAQDLHDGVGHGLAVIAMQAGVGLHVLDRDTEAVRDALTAIRETSREALTALRSELSQLTGEAAPRAPRRGLSDLGALVARMRSAGVEVRVVGEPPVAGEEVGAVAYAVVQESLTNVLRHAAARTATVEIGQQDGRMSITITDDGVGAMGHDEGMGLSGMRSRVTAVGGAFTAGPATGGGFCVRAVLPLTP